MSERPRRISTFDDPEEAFAYLREKRAKGEHWDMAEVRQMPDPPHTTNRYAVFEVPLPHTKGRDT